MYCVERYSSRDGWCLVDKFETFIAARLYLGGKLGHYRINWRGMTLLVKGS